MPKLKRLLIAAISIVMVAACATTPTSLDITDADRIQSVGIISIAGSRFYDEQLGITVFGNDLKLHTITAWGLDQAWEEKLTATVAQNTNYDASLLKVDRQPLLKIYEKPESIFAQYNSADFTQIADELVAISTANNVDALLVLTTGAAEIAGTNQVLEGLGLFSTRSLLGLKPPTYLYMIGVLSLVDGQTGEVLVSRPLNEKQTGWFGGGPYSIYHEMPKERKSKRFQDFTEEDIAYLKTQYIELLEAAWAPSVSALLKPKAPSTTN